MTPDLAIGIISFYGAPGTLKTSMAATWPKPLVMYDFEMGAHRCWGLRQNGASWLYNQTAPAGEWLPDLVTVRRYKLPERSITSRQEKLEGWIATWKQFTSDFAKDLQDPKVKTIMWDTATVEWSMCTDCYLEELQVQQISKGVALPDLRKQIIQIEYREPNSRQNTLLSSSTIYGKYLVLVHHETDEYVPITMGGYPVLDSNGQPRTTVSGRKLPDGFRYTTGKADWQFKASTRVVKAAKKNERDMTVPSIRIDKSALGIDLVGLEIDWFSYGKLIQMLTQLGRL